MMFTPIPSGLNFLCRGCFTSFESLAKSNAIETDSNCCLGSGWKFNTFFLEIVCKEVKLMWTMVNDEVSGFVYI